MNISVFNPTHFSTTNWSGGSTTQLYISPANASYAERNFDFRISSAKVEVPESTFTALPGVNRKLMVLEGEITLNHSLSRLFIGKNQHSKTLQKFEVDTFNGDWKTTAIGTCTDFNLMTRGGLLSDLSSLQVATNHTIHLKVEEHWKTLLLFVLKGSISIEINNKLHLLKKDNLMVLNNLNKFSFPLYANKHSEVIVSKIGK